MSKSRGFTLIELLVVVAIIALLVAILVPALEDARRQAAVVVCSSNLHQIGVGLAVYLTQWGDYPPPCAISTAIIHTNEVGLNQWDNRQVLVDIVDGAAKDIYYCPLWTSWRPEQSRTINEFSDYFYVDDLGVGVGRHYAGYNMMFLMKDWAGYTFDWSESGNPKGERPIPGDANSAIIADLNLLTYLGPIYGHSPSAGQFWEHAYYGGDWWITEDDFEESNILYGDGHVVTKHELQYSISRNGYIAGLY